jgi:osmotically-inducible protein OsmY
MGFVSFLFTALTGAAAMYLLDPQSGRRRAMLRDQINGMQGSSTDRVEALAENVVDRARGSATEVAHRFASEEVSDETLVARVRSDMGRYVSHPGAVDVRASGGFVTLEGNILANEVQPFVAKVKTIPGVRGVENRLQVHQEASNISDLQGGVTRTELL